MTQEMKVENYREELLAKAKEYHAEQAIKEADFAVEKEKHRIDSMIAEGKMKLSGAAYNAYFEKYKKDVYSDILEQRMSEAMKEIEKDVEGYMEELEKEAE